MRLLVPFSCRVSTTKETVSRPIAAISSMLFLYSSVQSTRWTCMAAPRKGSTPLAVRPLPLARVRDGASPALARSPGALPGQSTQPSTTAYMTTAAPIIPRPTMPLGSWESGRHDRDARGVLVVAGARGGSSRIFPPLAASRTNRRRFATPQAAEGSHRTRDHDPRHRLEDALRLGLRQISDGTKLHHAKSACPRAGERGCVES